MAKILLNESRAKVLEKPPPEKLRRNDVLAKASLAAKGYGFMLRGF